MKATDAPPFDGGAFAPLARSLGRCRASGVGPHGRLAHGVVVLIHCRPSPLGYDSDAWMKSHIQIGTLFVASHAALNDRVATSFIAPKRKAKGTHRSKARIKTATAATVASITDFFR